MSYGPGHGSIDLALALAVAAMLGGAGAVSPVDERRVAKARSLREQENEERRRARLARREAYEAARREKDRRAREIVDQINAGIDPTNGRPLSRQQKRAIARKGYYA